MYLPEEYRSYKLLIKFCDSKHFFSINPAEYWSFEKYFSETHVGENKTKKLNSIIQDYAVS